MEGETGVHVHGFMEVQKRGTHAGVYTYGKEKVIGMKHLGGNEGDNSKVQAAREISLTRVRENVI